jgi:anti-sigma factor RsiW
MTCDEARLLLHDHQRGRLSPERERELANHLAGCAACARATEVEAALTEQLERLPRYAAPASLKRRLARLAPAAAPVPLRPMRERLLAPAHTAAAALKRRLAQRAPPPPAQVLRPWRQRLLAPALAVATAAAAVVVTVAIVERTVSGAEPLAALTTEAVNDHLRVLQSEHPVEVLSGGTHEVKPWFEGKLDFAPAVPAPVPPDMRLEGGSVGYFLDRKAAVVVYGLRRHVVTMLVFSADGLRWPSGGAASLDGRTAYRSSSRGFHLILWRSGGLAYALVSDIDPAELSGIAARLAAET